VCTTTYTTTSAKSPEARDPNPLFALFARWNQERSINLESLPPDALNEKTIRQLLRNWHSLTTLGEHPLAHWGIVEAQRQAIGHSPTAAGRGLALREVLQAALENLKPDDGPPSPTENRWRSYLVLSEQYVQGRDPAWMQEHLLISKSTYYSAQKRALEMMADVLRVWEEEHRYRTAGAGRQL
jgi:hypothetical protein